MHIQINDRKYNDILFLYLTSKVYLVQGFIYFIGLSFGYSQASILSNKASFSQTQYITNVQHFTQNEGLSHWHVNTIIQDSQGFIWIGTNYGLNRFDGHSFQVFTKEQNGLASNEIRKILEDDEGWLWIFKYKHNFSREKLSISFVNIYTLEVQSIEQRFGVKSLLLFDKLYDAQSSPKKEIVGSTVSGDLIRYSTQKGFSLIKTNTTDRFHIEQFLSEHTILGAFNKKNKLRQYFKMDLDGKVSWSEAFYHFKDVPTCEEDKRIWFWRPSNNATPAPIEMMELTLDNKIIKFPTDSIVDGEKLLAHFRGKIFHNGFHHTFWYKSRHDFYVFHPKHGLLFDFKPWYSQIIDNHIKNIFFDNRNNTWVTTQNGVYKIQLKKSSFQKFLSLPDDLYNISDATSVRNIIIQQNKLWVTSENGWYKIDLHTKKVFSLPPIEYPDNLNRRTSSGLLSMAKFDSSQLLLGGKHLIRYNSNHHQYKTIKSNIKSLPMIWSIFEDSQHNFWLGTEENGLVKWHRGQDTLASFSQYNGFKQLKNSYIYTFLEWDQDLILVGSNSGIYFLHPQKGIIRRYWNQGKGSNYFPHNSIYHFYRDRKATNVVWVATGGGGLVRWPVPLQKPLGGDSSQIVSNFQQFTTTNGLSSNVIYAVYEDENHNLWLPTNYGITRLNKNNYSARTYVEEDGISHHEFNRISHHQGDDGTLYFGSLNGITVFHPNQIQDKKTLNDAPLIITKFLQFEGKKNMVINKLAELTSTNRIELKPGDKFFNLEFSLLDYQNGDRVRYSYKLEGRDDKWISLNDNKLNHVTLPYGNYTLKVRGQSTNGLFSKKQLELPVRVVPPLYLRTWFLISFLISVVGLIVIFYKWRTKKLGKRKQELEVEVIKATQTILQQNKELQNLDKLKSRFFANASHELRTPLTLIMASIQNSLKNNQLTNRDYTNLLLAHKNVQQLNKMINEMLDLKKLEAGKLELQTSNTVWYLFLKKIVASFESIAYQKNIAFHFQFDHQQQLQVSLDQKKVETIVQNLLSNAFKFTSSSGIINFHAKNDGPFLSISISDTGQGIASQDLPYIFDRFYQSKRKNKTIEGGTGIGLALSKELVQLMKGEIHADSELGKGSIFIVKIPRIEIIRQVTTSDAKKLENELSLNQLTSGLPSFINSVGTVYQKSGKRERIETSQEPGNSIKPSLLIVEDNYDLRTFIKQLLEPRYKIIEAENGQIALDYLNGFTEKKSHRQALHPQLIISDIMMPIFDGYQLLEAVKSNPETVNIPVIMLTAHGGLNEKLKALRIGVDDYMIKPFDEEELLARIDNLLRHSLSRQQYRKEQQTDKAYITEKDNDEYSHQHSEVNRLWLQQLETIALQKLGDFNYSVEQLSHDMATSRWTLYRRTKELIGLTPTSYLQELRLNLACQHLEQQNVVSIKALAYQVGFKDVKYFSQQFKKRFGRLPSSYLN